MNTKKLVLGFCALTAVIVGSTRIFGAELSPVAEARIDIELIRNTKASDPQMDAESVSLRNRQRSETDKLVRMGWYEVGCVEDAVSRYHDAFSLREIAAKKLETAEEELLAIQKLTADIDRVRQAKGLDADELERDEEVKRLRAELAMAEEQRALLLDECAYDNLMADNCIKVSQRLMDEASETRAQRMRYLVRLSEAEILRREIAMKRDLAIVKRLNSERDIPELKAIEVRSIQDRDARREVYDRISINSAFNRCISDVIESLPAENILRFYVIDDDLKKELFHPKDFEYLKDLEDFEDFDFSNLQRERIDTVFDNRLSSAVRRAAIRCTQPVVVVDHDFEDFSDCDDDA